LVDIVQRCLTRNLANRPTINDLKARIKQVPETPAASVPRPVVRETVGRAAPTHKLPRRHWLLPALALSLMILVAVGAGLHHSHSHAISRQGASQDPKTSMSARPEVTAASPSANPAESGPALARPVTQASDQPAPASADVAPSVLHQEIPDVLRSARESIHGHIKVTVRVTVDRSGKVVDETLESPGSSRYFARMATEAARKWRFAPADNQDSREWLLRFEFSRDGTTGRAATPQS
jgi:TonB family protein